MNKRSFIILLVLICISVASILLVSCEEEHVHAYGNWEIEADPTIDTEGLLVRTCSCGDRETMVIPKLSDSQYESHIAKHTSCFESGQMVYHIKLNGIEYEFFDEIPQLTHNYVVKINRDEHYKECTHCHTKIDIEAHNYDEVTHQCTCGKYDPHTGIEYMNFELLADDTYKLVSSESAYNNKLVIPSIYNGKKVTIIGDNSLKNLTHGVENVTIPNGITHIGKNAFYNFKSLLSIEIPSSVKTIDDTAFGQCIALQSVTFNEGLEDLGIAVFADCDALESVTLPSTIKKIGNAAFTGCDNLSTINFSDNASDVVVGDRAFNTCPKLDNLVVKNVASIGYAAFECCKSLTNVSFENVAVIDAMSFSACDKIDTITFDKTISAINNQAFHNCRSVTKVNYAGTVNEWKAINKDARWYDSFKVKVVSCSDGDTNL